MAIKVKAVERLLKFNKDDAGVQGCSMRGEVVKS